MPICVPPSWPSTNDAAASSAAMSRFGGMSVAHMLRDTSIARTTVVRPRRDRRRSPPAGPSRRPGCRARRGTARTAGGGGPATTPGTAARTSDRLEKRTPVRGRRSAQTRTATSSGRTRASSTRRAGHRNVMASARTSAATAAPPMSEQHEPERREQRRSARTAPCGRRAGCRRRRRSR